MMKMPEVMVSY